MHGLWIPDSETQIGVNKVGINANNPYCFSFSISLQDMENDPFLLVGSEKEEIVSLVLAIGFFSLEF